MKKMKTLALCTLMILGFSATITHASMTYTCYAKFGEDHPTLTGSVDVSADNNNEAVQKAYKWYKDNYPDVTVIGMKCS